MASLDRNLRRDLENAVKKARRIAEAGARQGLDQLAVGNPEPWPGLTAEQRKLRNRLRAHGRQLGDRLDGKGTQATDRIAGECAYEHWHRLLFARFLAENDLLVEPVSGMALPLEECRELARERGIDWLLLASDFAQRMLPQIFRSDDPVLEVTLPPEKRQELEALLEALPRDVFVADDSLGWVYQYWQSDRKSEVDARAGKIGADELSPVTQLFTEDYMVRFLLHNTLGAWWAGKVLAECSELVESADSEDALRRACAVPGVTWDFLRFVRDEEGKWSPAAGTYPTWPRAAKDITLLDPCMGSGHFLAFALPLLTALRSKEECLSPGDAVGRVLAENIFGLELDARCAQIAAFNLAFTAWRLGGLQQLPQLNLACSGLAIAASESQWCDLATDVRSRAAMKSLFDLFKQAPVLGSLIDPMSVRGTLFAADFAAVRPLLERALHSERTDVDATELAVVARGVERAAATMVSRFTLIATNVPYLGADKQEQTLREFCAAHYPRSQADLATCFLERCLSWSASNGTVAVVMPQNWLSLKTYAPLRKHLLASYSWPLVGLLGPAAFSEMNWWAANTALLVVQNTRPQDDALFRGVDASSPRTIDEKVQLLTGATHSGAASHFASDAGTSSGEVLEAVQSQIRTAPGSVMAFADSDTSGWMANWVTVHYGFKPGQTARVTRRFWEVPSTSIGGGQRWALLESTPDGERLCSGKGEVILTADAMRADGISEFGESGREAWTKSGVVVGKMGRLPASIYAGGVFDDNTYVLLPKAAEDLPALVAFTTSSEFCTLVRRRNRKVSVDTQSMVRVRFDRSRWEAEAQSRWPTGLPGPVSNDPAQWTFDGSLSASRLPLQVAVARLMGFSWPGEHEEYRFADLCDADGIVCHQALYGEPPAADRLRSLLAAEFGPAWSTAKLNELLDGVGFGGRSLAEWLQESFFEQHCEVFQQRPFVWHVWDGLKNGFNAYVNYHKLAARAGEGRRVLEKLIFTYLGDWIDRQRSDQKAGVEGADGRVAAAEHLKRELERILEGEPPYDIFVRWKPLHEQAIGWAPDIDDGVRINIRPFINARPLNARSRTACVLRMTPKIKFEKDRGKDSSKPKIDFPWLWGWDGQADDFLGGPEFEGNRWVDLHYSRSTKLAARERAKGGKS